MYFQRFFADEMNSREPLPELHKVFIPHITMPENSNRKHEKKAGIVRLGIRDTCQACSFKKGTEKEDIERAKATNKPLLYTGGYRGDFLAKVFQGNEYTEFDVNASIYRITLLLKNGVWPKEAGKDLYNSFIGTDCGEFRPFVKLLAMIIYFQSDRTVREIANSESCRKVFGKNVTFQERIDFVATMKENMQRILGNSLGSEVFLHESCIYMAFNYELQKLGYRVVQIYDGFYTNAPKDFNFEALLVQVAEWYFEAFIKQEKADCHRLSA